MGTPKSPQSNRARPTAVKPTNGAAKSEVPRTNVTLSPALREHTEKMKRKVAQRKKQGPQLSSTAWTFIISGIVVTAIIAFAIFANNQPKAAATVVCGINNPTIGALTKSDALTVGSIAPEFSNLVGSDCKTYSSSQFANKVTMLELFAPWCPYCQAETATFTKLQTLNAGKGFQMLSISASPYGKDYETKSDTTPSSMSDIKWFSDTFSLNYPTIFDPGMTTVNAYGLTNGGYPTMYVINKHGIITYAASGEVISDQLQSAITKALNS